MKFIRNLARPLWLDFEGALKKDLIEKLLIFYRNLNFPKIQEVLTPPRDQILNEKVKKKVKKK